MLEQNYNTTNTYKSMRYIRGKVKTFVQNIISFLIFGLM